MLNTREEIIEYLEQELEDASQSWLEWMLIDMDESMKHRIKANTIEHILDDLELVESVERKPRKADQQQLELQQLSKVTRKIYHFAKRQKDSVISFDEVMDYLSSLNPTEKQVALVLHYLKINEIEVIQIDSK